MCLVRFKPSSNQVITTLIYRNAVYELSEILNKFKQIIHISNYILKISYYLT